MKRRVRFSERIGVVKSRETFQVDSMDAALRNSLWNLLVRDVLGDISAGALDLGLQYTLAPIWESFLHLPLDDLTATPLTVRQKFRQIFFSPSFEWYSVYDLLEFIAADAPPGTLRVDRKAFQAKANRILEEHLSAFRFVGAKLAPIVREEEIQSIDEAMQQAWRERLYGAEEHLQAALALLAKRPEPDYRNSIKESVSAVEAVVKVLSGERGGGLSRALRKLDEKVQFHPAFRDGLEKLYGYTSDAEGIRHAILERPSVGLDEAKYMLVMCSALVNYMIAKAHEHGLLS